MMSNNTKVWIFILASSLGFLIIGNQVGERLGLLVGFILALLLNTFIFIFGDSRVLLEMKAQKISGQDPYKIHQIVTELCRALHMTPPLIYITPHSSLNCLCAGAKFRQASLIFTQGLLDRLNPEELRTVIAHQLFHIQNLNSLRFNVASTLANSFVGFGLFLDKIFLNKIQVFSKFFSPLAAGIIRLVFRKKSFLENDLNTVQLLGDRQKLGEVLWKLESLSQTKPLQPPLCSDHLFMVKPNGLKDSLLNPHPQLNLRIKKLVGYYPI